MHAADAASHRKSASRMKSLRDIYISGSSIPIIRPQSVLHLHSRLHSQSELHPYTRRTPCRKYYQWALDENLPPESGQTMLDRIVYEYQNNLQWSLDNYGRHTWDDFIHSTETPDILADVWCWAYERPGSPDMLQRYANAEWCFDNIKGGHLKPIFLMLFGKNNSLRKVVKPRCQGI